MDSRKNIPENSWVTPCIDFRQDEWRFVKQALLGKLFLPWRRASERKLEHLKNRLLTRFAMSAADEAEYQEYVQAFEESWPRMREKFWKNPVLYQFMLEYGVHSEFFYPFLMRVPEAATLDIVSGRGFDMLGRYREIPRTDAMYPFIFGDEMFRWIDIRMRGEQKYLQDAEKVMFLGGGLLQALRYQNYKPRMANQEIVAVDANANLTEDLEKVFGVPFDQFQERLNIRYLFESAQETFRRPEFKRYFTMVDASGIFSYRRNLDELREMLRGALEMLRLDGVLVFDLQILTLTLLFDKFLLDWNTDPSMKPENKVEAAIKLVREVCAELGAIVEVIHHTDIGIQFVVYPPIKVWTKEAHM